MAPHPVRALSIILTIGAILRFLYFPDNIYFGGEQARDAFAAHDVLHGSYPLIGPYTTLEGVYHSPLYYYALAPLYFASGGDPMLPAAALRVINVLAAIPIYILGSILFQPWVGIIAAIIYAISFEHIQISLFLSHPSLGIGSIILAYYGLAHFLFKKKPWGLAVACFFYGLAIQFDVVYAYVPVTMLIILLLLRHEIPATKRHVWGISVASLLLHGGVYLAMDHFASLHTLTVLSRYITVRFLPQQTFVGLITKLFSTIVLWTNDILSLQSMGSIALLAVLSIFIAFSMRKAKKRSQYIFLIIWVCSGLLPYLFTSPKWLTYHYGGGASVGLILLVAVALQFLYSKSKFLFLTCMGILLILGILRNIVNNKDGPMEKIISPKGQLYTYEKSIIDGLYLQDPASYTAYAALLHSPGGDLLTTYLLEYYALPRYGHLPLTKYPPVLR